MITITTLAFSFSLKTRDVLLCFYFLSIFCCNLGWIKSFKEAYELPYPIHEYIHSPWVFSPFINNKKKHFILIKNVNPHREAKLVMKMHLQI